MSTPSQIRDLEVLNRDYSVEGWAWGTETDGHLYMYWDKDPKRRAWVDSACVFSVLGVPVAVAIALSCASMGIPVPCASEVTAETQTLAAELAALKEHVKQVEMYRDIFMRQREDFGDELDELNESLWKVRTRFIGALGQKQERPTSAIDSVAHILVLGDQAIAELKRLREIAAAALGESPRNSRAAKLLAQALPPEPR